MRLLILEDMRDMSSLYSSVLGPYFDAIDTATSVARAKDLIEEHSHGFLIVDLNVDDSLGVETLEKVWNYHPSDPRIIVITGVKTDELKKKCMDLGANAVLRKDESLSIHVLKHEVERLLGEKKEDQDRTVDRLIAEANEIVEKQTIDKLEHIVVTKDVTKPREPKVAKKELNIAKMLKSWQTMVVAGIFVLGGGGAQFLYTSLYADSVKTEIDTVFAPLKVNVDTNTIAIQSMQRDQKAIKEQGLAIISLLNEMATDKQRATAKSKSSFGRTND